MNTTIQPLPTIRADRLRLVIDAVESAPPEGFDMQYFRGRSECGTVACAAGWYCVRNPEADLYAYPGEDDGAIGGLILNLPDDDPDAENPPEDFDAAAAHFGLTRDEAFYLFAYDMEDDSQNHRPAVLARLRAFVDSAGLSMPGSPRTP